MPALTAVLVAGSWLIGCGSDGARASGRDAGSDLDHRDGGGSAGATASGGTTSAGGTASGSGGTSGSGAVSSGSGGAGAARPGTGSVDAGNDAKAADAGRSTMDAAPVCLGVQEACGPTTGTCCEAYACRDGKCCTPTGVWSYCHSGSECCSGSCVLNQCTCVPLGYSCTGAGQCCSGFSCVNGTCICPPDIRGC